MTSPTQDQAVRRLAEDAGNVAASLLCPVLTPAWYFGQAVYEVARNSEGRADSFLREAPRLAFGFLNILPSVATTTFVTPEILAGLAKRISKKNPDSLLAVLLNRSAAGRFKQSSALLVSPVFGWLYRFISHPVVAASLLGLSVVTGALHLYQGTQEFREGKSDRLTYACTLASAFLLYTPTFLFNTFPGTPRHTVTRNSEADRIDVRFESPRKLTLHEGPQWNFWLSVARGMRRIFYHHAPRCLWAFQPEGRNVRLALQERMAMETSVMHLTGLETFSVRGGRHLTTAVQSASEQGVAVQVMQLVHDRLTNFVEIPLAAELSGHLQRLMMKPSLGEMRLLSLAGSETLGHQLMLNVPKNTAATANNLLAGLGLYYNQGIFEAQGVFVAYVRTVGRNLAANLRGTKYVRTAQGIVRRANVLMGPDAPNVIYLPYLPPYQAALQAAAIKGDTLLVHSTLATTYREGQLRGVEVEYFPALSAREWFPQGTGTMDAAAARLHAEVTKRLIDNWFPNNPLIREVRLVNYPVPKHRERVVDFSVREGQRS